MATTKQLESNVWWHHCIQVKYGQFGKEYEGFDCQLLITTNVAPPTYKLSTCIDSS